MGFWTGIGRIILIIVNLVLLIASLAILAGGVLLKFFTPVVAPILLGVDVSVLDEDTKKNFTIPSLSDVTELPFVDEIGTALIAFGCLLCIISFLACCGACYKFRPLLIGFVILMAVLLISQAVVGGLFLDKDSVLHDIVKDTVGDKIKTDYKRDGDDVFSFSIDLLNYALGCCGIRDWDDFEGSKPPSCCNRTIIDGDSSWDNKKSQCTTDPPTAPDSYYNEQGCYELLQEHVLSDLALSAGAFSAILVVQLMEIIFAVLIVKNMNAPDNKVQPYGR